MVWAEKPVGKRIGIAYSTFKEAQLQAVSLERAGYNNPGNRPDEPAEAQFVTG